MLNTLAKGMKTTFSPKVIVHELTSLTVKEKFFLCAWVLVQTAAFLLAGDFSVLGWIGVATGIFTALSLILVNRGLITNYFWGLLSTFAWLLVALHTRLIGDLSSQTFYFVMQFIGIAIWFKQMNQAESNHVHARKLTALQWLGVGILCLVIYVLNVLVAKHFHGTQIFLDATLLPLGIVGQILMTYSYVGQWFFWILIDAVNVVIWTNNLLAQGATGAVVSMFILNILMLANAVYGTYCWVSDAKKTAIEIKKGTVYANE